MLNFTTVGCCVFHSFVESGSDYGEIIQQNPVLHLSYQINSYKDIRSELIDRLNILVKDVDKHYFSESLKEVLGKH